MVVCELIITVLCCYFLSCCLHWWECLHSAPHSTTYSSRGRRRRGGRWTNWSAVILEGAWRGGKGAVYWAGVVDYWYKVGLLIRGVTSSRLQITGFTPLSPEIYISYWRQLYWNTSGKVHTSLESGVWTNELGTSGFGTGAWRADQDTGGLYPGESVE